jgi:hypothetical protein
MENEPKGGVAATKIAGFAKDPAPSEVPWLKNPLTKI